MYRSPIELIYADMSSYMDDVAKKVDEDIWQAIVRYDVNIDKDELIRALKYDRDQYQKGYADGEADATPKWISVKDRLPEVTTTHNTRWDKSTDSIRVLCACVQADGKKMVKEGYCKVYSDGFVHWKIPGTIHSVTHWQYLPQPPKGE